MDARTARDLDNYITGHRGEDQFDNFPDVCPECGSDDIDGHDLEGLWDCYECGIWFDPDFVEDSL